MIYHDSCTIVAESQGQNGDMIEKARWENVACEFTPINSVEGNASGPIVTRYRFFTGFDIESRLAPVGASSVVLEYRGETVQVEGGFERHTVVGRFHHYEAIVQNLYGQF